MEMVEISSKFLYAGANLPHRTKMPSFPYGGISKILFVFLRRPQKFAQSDMGKERHPFQKMKDMKKEIWS